MHIKFLFYCLLAGSVLFISCRKDEHKVANIYVAFNFTGDKIDTSSQDKNRIIFRNVDGTPLVYVNASEHKLCEDAVKVGTYSVSDSINWHLRLVDPDGDPAHFNIWINENREISLITDSLHFVKPEVHDFNVELKDCKIGQTIVITN